MSIDTVLRTQLTSAVEDTTVPPGLARGAMAGGRRRRRRRAAVGGLALAAVSVVATTVVQLPGGGSLGRDGDVAAGTSADLADGLAWARSLPQGADPALPFFGEGGLWSDGRMYDTLGEEVSYDYPPREVDGGWLVVTGQDEEQLGLAVMAADGSLRSLPGGTSVEGYGDARVVVSPDGRRVAFGSWVVDLTTMQATQVPHLPESDSDADNLGTEIRMIGFTEDGLVYQGAPFAEGFGTTWLLRDDGTTTEVEPPKGAFVSDTDAADVAVDYQYYAGNTDTCMTTYRLRGTTWEEFRSDCMGQRLDEALGVSPGVEWLLTDDLPRVWSIADGRFYRLDMPVGIGPAQMAAQRGGAVWESDDTFLLPFADRWAGPRSPEPEFMQSVQVVRCTMSTLTCERAGREQTLPVVTTMWGTSQLAFASPSSAATRG